MSFVRCFACGCLYHIALVVVHVALVAPHDAPRLHAAAVVSLCRRDLLLSFIKVICLNLIALLVVLENMINLKLRSMFLYSTAQKQKYVCYSIGPLTPVQLIGKSDTP